MREPIDLDRDPRGLAEEIEYERAERMLPAEPETFRTKPKDAPKADFRRAHSFTELTSFTDGQDPSTSFAGSSPHEIVGRMSRSHRWIASQRSR